MQYPSSLILDSNKKSLKQWLIVLTGLDLLILGLIFASTHLSNGPLKLMALVSFTVMLLITVLALYRLIMAKYRGQWFKFSKNGLRDNFGLLGLGKIAIEDLKYIQVVKVNGWFFLKAKISPEGQCFHDLDEPKGLIVDIYNLFFTGRVWWPLHLLDVNSDRLIAYLKYYNEYIQHLKEEQSIKPTHSLKLNTRRPRKPAETVPEPPPIAKKQMESDFENTSIELDEVSVMDYLDDDTQVTTSEGFDKTIQTIPDSESISFARKLCDAYVEGLRWLPKQATVSEATTTSLISNIDLSKKSDNLEEVSFTFKDQAWKMTVERQEAALTAIVRLYISDELVFAVEALIELGSLEPSQILHELPGMWKQQALELFENLQQNKGFSV